MPRSDWPIVVGGCHRSGTSLLRQLLDAHPRIHCGPEITFFRDPYAGYFEDPLRHLRFTTTARSILPEDDLLEILGGAFVALHERAARKADKARCADKAPENVLYTDGWQRLLGDCWVLVQVVRNPLDTLASMKEARFPLTFPPDLDGRIDFYRRYTEAGLDFGDRNPERYRRVVYEELCATPGEALAGLMSWLAESVDARQLALEHDRHAAGLEDPKVAGTTAVHQQSVGRWSATLTEEEAERVRERTGDLWSRIAPAEA
jgi:Sulfotransferase family